MCGVTGNITEACVERVAWTPEVAESNCPDGYFGDKGYGTAKICPDLLRRKDGFFDRADILYEASFNLSLANHLFRSCYAKCLYDINNEGVVYQWKGDCWKMQTKWACVSVHVNEYVWATEYISKRLCPAKPTMKVPTPAPTPFVCVERQTVWNEEIALKACPYELMGSTNKGASAVTCEGYEDYQYRLNRSLANRMFLECYNWCVYDIYKKADAAFIWSNSKKCWKPVTRGLCISTLTNSRREMKDYVENVLCASTTGEPTEAPTCFEQREWDENAMNDLCDEDETGSTFKHYSNSDRAAVACADYKANEADLFKSLAMRLFADCSAWCVYDYASMARLAWKWSNSGKCWKLASMGTCHYDYQKKENNTDWLHAMEQMENVCTYSPTMSPTDCTPYYNWTEERAEDLCPSTEDYGPADKSYGVQVCEDSADKQASLEKTLANNFFTKCGSWCLYDYDTIMNSHRSPTSTGGFIWKDTCWKWVTGYTCFVQSAADFEKIREKAKDQCDLQ